MTQSKPPLDDPLEAALAHARQARPEMPDCLLARVMADAEAEMPQPRRLPVWRQIFGTLGGWPAMAGLAATACVGLWVGGAMPDDVMFAFDPVTSAALETGTGLSAFDLLLVDG